jgi:hypothetical protein
MPWFKVDDGFANSEPVMKLPRRYRANAIGLWTLSGTWCAKELTDGRVPLYMVEELSGTRAQARLLVDAGLWVETSEGYEFVGWEKYQPTRAEVEEARLKEAERKRKWRMSRRDTSGTHAGQDAGLRAESGHPDPTRPDPLTTSNEVVTEKKSTRGSRLPETWHPAPALVAWTEQTAPGVDWQSELDVFRDYWVAQPGQKGVKTDWDSTWRNWIRRKAQSPAPGAYKRPTRREENLNVLAEIQREQAQRELTR